MKKLRTFEILIVACMVFGCDGLSQQWPPPLPANPAPDFTPTSRVEFNEWVHVYADSAKSEPISMAYVIRDVKYELPFNLFAIDRPDDRYVESQFEVVYFDESRTLIQAVSDQDDGVALVRGDNVFSVTYGFTFPGAKVRYGEKVYELRRDGWYLDKRRLHSFTTSVEMSQR